MYKNIYWKYIIKWSFRLNVVVYTCSCLTPYIHPKYFFPLTFLALVFPLLLFSMLAWVLFYLFKKNKNALIALIVIALGYKNIGSNFGFSLTHHQQNTNTKTIKLLSWNVRNFIAADSLLFAKRTSSKYFNFIDSTNADVVCLQDASDWIDTVNHNSFIMQHTSKYPYKYFSTDIDQMKYDKNEKYGTCILSKYPIIFSHHINYNGKIFTESLALANINVNGKIIRFYNTHLKSMYIKIAPEQKSQEYFGYKIEDTNLIFHGNAFTKIKRFDTAHIAQAQLIKKVMDTTTVPFVFCGDLNSTPSSYVYHTLSKNLKDAFTENYTGMQATYLSKLPFLRIDVVLASKGLQPITYQSPRYRLSDHCPIITTIAIPN